MSTLSVQSGENYLVLRVSIPNGDTTFHWQATGTKVPGSTDGIDEGDLHHHMMRRGLKLRQLLPFHTELSTLLARVNSYPHVVSGVRKNPSDWPTYRERIAQIAGYAIEQATTENGVDTNRVFKQLEDLIAEAQVEALGIPHPPVLHRTVAASGSERRQAILKATQDRLGPFLPRIEGAEADPDYSVHTLREEVAEVARCLSLVIESLTPSPLEEKT